MGKKLMPNDWSAIKIMLGSNLPIVTCRQIRPESMVLSWRGASAAVDGA